MAISLWERFLPTDDSIGTISAHLFAAVLREWARGNLTAGQAKTKLEDFLAAKYGGMESKTDLVFSAAEITQLGAIQTKLTTGVFSISDLHDAILLYRVEVYTEAEAETALGL